MAILASVCACCSGPTCAGELSLVGMSGETGKVPQDALSSSGHLHAAGCVKEMYCSSLFQLAPFTPSCTPPTPPKNINWWEGLRWASVMFGSCYLRTLPTQFVLQVCCSRVCSSHASCHWPTASCKMLIAQKWGHCPLHFIFYPPFPLKLSKTTYSHWYWALLILSQFCSSLWGTAETHLEVRGEKENGGGGQPTLTVKAHQHLCHFSTIRTHALQMQNLGREQLSTDPAQNAIKY